MTDRVAYPDTSILPEKCRPCPSIESELAAWSAFHVGTDLMLQVNMENATDQDSFFDYAAQTVPAFMVHGLSVLFGDVFQRELDPESFEDRRLLIREMCTPGATGYNALNEAISTIEAEIQAKTSNCEQKGPLNLRVPVKQSGAASVIVSICRNDVKSAGTQPSTAQVKVRRETSR